MECRNCGVSNLDGAERCSGCKQVLDVGPGLEGNNGESHRVRSTWVVMGVTASAVVALVAVLMSASGGNPGTGGRSAAEGPESTSSTETLGSIEASEVTTMPVAPEQRSRVLEVAEAILDEDFPDMKGVTPNVVAYRYRGETFVDAVYETQVTVEGSDGPIQIPRTVVISLAESTGEVSVYASG